MSAEVGLTEAERGYRYEHYDADETHMGPCYLEADVARIKADAIAQERAAWVAKVRSLDTGYTGGGNRHAYCIDPQHLRALLSSDATAACACVCHSGGVGTGCRQSRCEVCPPATAALNTVREQAKAEGRVHNHPPYRPACNERLVEGQLRGACLNDDGSEAGR